MSLEQIADVNIDTGDFKYILIEVKKRGTDGNKRIVRGYKRCPYHADVLEETRKDNSLTGCDLHVLGGGRINHDAKKKEIVVYGESVQFGPANHEESVAIIKKKYPEHKVTVG